MKHALLMLLCYLAGSWMLCQADVLDAAMNYSFPIKPEDETWKTYETAKELKGPLQIPSDNHEIKIGTVAISIIWQE